MNLAQQVRGLLCLVGLCLTLCSFTTSPLLAQTTIKGIVTNAANGEPLIGVNATEKGTPNGTITDFEGNYTLNLKNENATLIFTYIGFSDKEVAVEGRT